MRKIINGRLFDTASAELIGEASSDAPRNDFRWFREALYRTPRSKRFFLAGEGGAMTHWGRTVDGDGRIGGEGLVPLSDADALAWAEAHLTVGVIELTFGDAIDDA